MESSPPSPSRAPSPSAEDVCPAARYGGSDVQPSAVAADDDLSSAPEFLPQGFVCIGCEYDLSGLEVGSHSCCSECGREIDAIDWRIHVSREMFLRQSARRVFVGLLGLVVLFVLLAALPVVIRHTTWRVWRVVVAMASVLLIGPGLMLIVAMLQPTRLLRKLSAWTAVRSCAMLQPVWIVTAAAGCLAAIVISKNSGLTLWITSGSVIGALGLAFLTFAMWDDRFWGSIRVLGVERRKLGHLYTIAAVITGIGSSIVGMAAAFLWREAW